MALFPLSYVPYKISDWWYKSEPPPKSHFDLTNDYNTQSSSSDDEFEGKYKAAMAKSGVSHINYDTDKYEVSLDVSHFKPEELEIKVNDNCILIEGHHDETQDEHGFVTRSFKRRYILPSDITPESIAASISSDGILHLEAKRPKHDDKVEKCIPITVQT